MNYEIFLPQAEMMGKVLLSALFGGLIGHYRRGKRAGVRTLALISIGATLFTLISIYGFGANEARMVANIVTGIGFIGAGVIWKQEKAIEGITTAATIWVSAAIGITIALSMWLIAVFTVLLTISILKSRMDARIGRNK